MEAKKNLDFSDLWRCSLGFLTVWISHLGRRFGILQALARNGSLTVEELSQMNYLHSPAVSLWCEAAYSLGLIDRDSNRYYLSGKRCSLLVDEVNREYIGGQFSYLALRSLDYDAFDDFFKRGKLHSFSRNLAEAYDEATKWDHTAFLDTLCRIPKIHLLLSKGARVLDVGSGTGEWVLRLAKVFPNSSFNGIDPNRSVVTIARVKAKSQYLNNVRFSVGTGESIRYEESFDMIYLGEVLCIVQSKLKILKNCFHALRPSGYLVIAEGLIDKKAGIRKRENQIIYAMQLDFALQGAVFLSKNELKNLLLEAGFKSPIFMKAGGGLWFIIVRK